MSTAIRPMRADEYPAWLEASAARYAEDIVENGGFMDEAQARQKSQDDYDRLLPDGVSTPGHHIWVVLDDDGSSVGSLWVAEREFDGGPSAFVYEIRIEEAHRGRGHGRAAMLLAEEEARALGLDRITLNVFGGNQVARNLYRSLGYDEHAVIMGKPLS